MPRHHLWGEYDPNGRALILPVEMRVLQQMEGILAFERNGQWDDAVRGYQKLIEEESAAAIPSPAEKELFVGVAPFCFDRIRSTPSLLAAYQTAFDERFRTGAALAVESGDLDSLATLTSLYPLASSAEGVLLRLGADLFEQGRFDEAEAALRRCLESFPRAGPRVLPLLALVARRKGDEETLRELADLAAKGGLSSCEVDVGGRRETLGTLIRDLAAGTHPRADYARLQDHERPRAGAIGRSRMRWRFEAHHRVTGAMVLPALLGNRLFANYNGEFVVLDVRNGKIIALSKGETEEEFEREPLRYGPEESPPLMGFWGVTGEGDVGFATMPDTVPELGPGGRMLHRPIRVIEVLDARNHSVRYRVEDKTLSFPAPPEAVACAVFAGAARRESSSTPADSCLVKLDAATGRIEWTRFLCLNSGKNVPLFGTFRNTAPGFVSWHRGRIFVSTNNGVLASLDSAGRILWLRAYDQGRSPVMPCAPLAWRETVVFACLDQERIEACEAASGKCLWSRSVRGGRPVYVEGIVDGRLYLSGPELICLDVRTGRLVWQIPLSARQVGKGAVTQDSVYIPTLQGVERYSLRDGTGRRVHEWEDPAQDPGSLMLVPGGFLTVRTERISCFELEKP